MIASSFSPVIGGAESYATVVSSGLAAQGHDVTVATDVPHGQRPEGPFADPDRIAVHRFSDYRALLGDPSKIRWEQMAFSLMPELAACAEESRPDLILTNSLDTAQLGKILALELDLPWAAAFHEHAPEDEPLARGRLRFVYDALRPSLVLAGSRFYAERARRWSSDVPLKLIYHGIDTDAFHPDQDGTATRDGYGFEAEDLVILCAGRLKPRKGILDLVHAFRFVHERHPRARLLIAGSISSASRDYAARLEDEIDRLRLRDVVIVDRALTFDRMPSVLAAADVVAQPSWEEGLGLSLLEAMSSGRATVATDVAGHREILSVPGIALVVPPARPGALADALSSLLKAPKLRERLGVRARAHVEDCFSRRRMLREIEAALRGVVDAHRRSALANV
jgi:glycosyltransferase involved in cell wall biosynthesis